MSLDAVAKQESSHAQLHDQMMRVCEREDLSVVATREKGGAGRGGKEGGWVEKEGGGKGGEASMCRSSHSLILFFCYT